MKKCMISQPMGGLSDEQIVETRNKWLAWCKEKGYEPVNTFFTDEFKEANDIMNKPLAFLARSLMHMACCDMAYFAVGWKKARGCTIEHTVAEKYGIMIVYEDL